MWSVGCVLAELFLKNPLFGGESDIEQLALVISCLGHPPDEWQSMPDFNKISFSLNEEDLKSKNQKFLEKLNDSVKNEQMIDLIMNLCCYQNRMSSQKALDHSLFLLFRAKGVNANLLHKPTKVRQTSCTRDFLGTK